MKLSYRWVIVAVGALMTCVGIGALFSLAVYLAPMSAQTGWSRTGISSAMTLDFLVVLVGLSAASFFAPMIAATTLWFQDNRSLAGLGGNDSWLYIGSFSIALGALAFPPLPRHALQPA